MTRSRNCNGMYLAVEISISEDTSGNQLSGLVENVCFIQGNQLFGNRAWAWKITVSAMATSYFPDFMGHMS